MDDFKQLIQTLVRQIREALEDGRLSVIEIIRIVRTLSEIASEILPFILPLVVAGPNKPTCDKEDCDCEEAKEQ